jgi:hypothetical protein
MAARSAIGIFLGGLMTFAGLASPFVLATQRTASRDNARTAVVLPRDTIAVTRRAARAATGARPRTGSELVCEYISAGSPEPTACPDSGNVPIGDVAVAIIPDPLDSHLDWAFDSAIESIRRAFEHAHYVLDRYWLPWRPEPDSGHLAPEQAPASRSNAPGVLLFRSDWPDDSSIALVYLVGETPTRGIHAAAFRAALEDRKSALGRWPGTRGPDTLRIVGPVFSGSSRSLRDALRAFYRADTTAVLILSGGATGAQNPRILRQCVAGAENYGAGRPCAGPRVRFFATVNPLDVLKRTMETILRREFNVDRSQIAYLTESGTQYGRSWLGERTESETLQRPDTLPLEIPFPMNISRLREDYTREAAPIDTGRLSNVSRTRLNWRDPASVSESPPAISELTGPIIERTITDIEQTLLLHRIRAIGIIATDVRDRLFLANVVKERVRDLQVVIIGSHALYMRPEINEQLRGTLVVSTYPLFLENQFWDLTHNRDRQRLVFTSDLSEGIYNATAAQLGYEADLLDYVFPMSFTGQAVLTPPVWLTVIGANSILPLVAESTGVRLADRATAYVYVRSHSPPPRRFPESRDSGPERAIVTVGLLILVLLTSIGHARSTLRLFVAARDRIALLFGRTPSRIGAQGSAPAVLLRSAAISEPTRLAWRSDQLHLLYHEQAWLVFRFAAVVCALVPLSFVLFRPREHGSNISQLGLVIIAAATVVAFLIVVWAAAEEVRARSGHARVARRGALVRPIPWRRIRVYLRRIGWRRMRVFLRAIRWRRVLIATAQFVFSQYGGMLIVAAAYVGLSILLLVRVSTFPDAYAAMFFLRTLQLNSGVTPAVPLFVGAILLIAWCTWHLDRVRLLGVRTAFEIACSDAQIDASVPTRSGPAVGPAEDRRILRDGAELQACVRRVRTGLIDFMPSSWGVGWLIGVGLLTPWILWLATRSMESAILGPLFGDRRLPSAFDVIVRFLIFSAITLAVWSISRLSAVWGALRSCLSSVEALPLGNAFDRLPNAIASVGRFTPFASASRSAVRLTIDRAAHARWVELGRVVHRSDPVRQWVSFSAAEPSPAMLTSDIGGGFWVADPLIALHRSLSDATARDELRGALVETESGQRLASRNRGSLLPIQELEALYIIDYVEWVVRHLRRLALYLIVCLTLTNVLLSSYPFTPGSIIRVLFFATMGLAVLTIAVILVQMNRNPTLSRINRTSAGEVTWDRQFIINLILVTGVPLLSVLTAEVPGVRDFLFSWVTPLLKAIGKS